MHVLIFIIGQTNRNKIYDNEKPSGPLLGLIMMSH
jgi:hypothetical protein